MLYILSIYSLVFLLSFTDFSKKYNSLGINFSIILLSMLAGFRNVGGIDFGKYRFFYETGLSIGKTEMGYNFVNSLFHGMGLSYNMFLFIISFISILFLIKSFQKISIYPKLSLLLYMGTYFFFYNMVLNRQMIAVSLVLWIIFFWEKNNKKYSLLLFFIAFSFHKSIIVILPFLILFDFVKGKKFMWMILMIVGIILAIFITPRNLMDLLFSGETMINDRIGGYMRRQENSIVSYNVQILEYVKVLIMLSIIIPIFKTLYTNSKTFIWLFLYLVGIIFLIWSSKYGIMFRLFMYFDMSFTVLFAYCLEIYLSRFRLSNQQSKLIKILTYSIIGIITIGSIYYRTSNFHGFSEYQFYFMENL